MIARLLVVPFGSVWRLRELCSSRNRVVAWVARKVYAWYQYEQNCDIAWNAAFSGKPCFPHGMNGIFVSGDAVIGKDCVIFQQVTIGSVTLPDANNRGAPVIGDNVYIGSGAKVVGNVRVGNNVRIGANAVVYRDVPDNCVVVSGEQRTIPRENELDNHYYSRRGGKWMRFENGRFVAVEDADLLARLNAAGNRSVDD